MILLRNLKWSNVNATGINLRFVCRFDRFGFLIRLIIGDDYKLIMMEIIAIWLVDVSFTKCKPSWIHTTERRARTTMSLVCLIWVFYLFGVACFKAVQVIINLNLIDILVYLLKSLVIWQSTGYHSFKWNPMSRLHHYLLFVYYSRSVWSLVSKIFIIQFIATHLFFVYSRVL